MILDEEFEMLNRAIQQVKPVIGDKWDGTNQPGSIIGNVTYGCGSNMKKRAFTIIGPKAVQSVQENMWLESLMQYMVSFDPDTTERLLKEIVRLHQENDKLAGERDHWKANHECEVSRARVLKERPDMPLERIKAYDRMVELEKENEALKQRIASLEDVAQTRVMLEMIHSMVIDTQQMSREQLRYWQTHFRNPNGW
ncbi:hypothetical protein GuL6_175 [Buttiauxella phage vB_ButM_GuL6]|nr:hypothetical protein GuL6_175 [Buttiauxella phage vB_ButM_GuL6]